MPVRPEERSGDFLMKQGTAILSSSSEMDIILPQQPLVTNLNVFAVEDSPFIPRGRATKRIIHESSSPQKKQPEANPKIGSNTPSLTAPRKLGKLVRASDRVSETRIKSRSTKRHKKLPGDACPFFDLRAVNSDDPESETEPEDNDGIET